MTHDPHALRAFVVALRSGARTIVSGGRAADGTETTELQTGAGLTDEDIAAEAFNQDVFDVEAMPWSEAVRAVAAIDGGTISKAATVAPGPGHPQVRPPFLQQRAIGFVDDAGRVHLRRR